MAKQQPARAVPRRAVSKQQPVRAVPRAPGRKAIAESDFRALMTYAQTSAVEGAVLSGSSDPSELPLDRIDEDPHQPRRSFDEEALGELAATIRARGVLQPISVRPNPSREGRYIINFGARRYRASKIAGRNTIPVVVQSDATSDDQVIENLHRDALGALDIAEFIDRQVKKGRKKTDIAASIGKSPAFVSQYSALLSLPAELQGVFDAGRCRDVSLMSELRKLRDQHPAETRAWLSESTNELTRSSVAVFREYLEQGSPGVDLGAKPPDAMPKRGGRPVKPRGVLLDEERGERFSNALGMHVRVEPNQIRIMYASPEELARLEQLLLR